MGGESIRVVNPDPEDCEFLLPTASPLSAASPSCLRALLRLDRAHSVRRHSDPSTGAQNALPPSAAPPVHLGCPTPAHHCCAGRVAAKLALTSGALVVTLLCSKHRRVHLILDWWPSCIPLY